MSVKWDMRGDSRSAENALKRTGTAMGRVGKQTKVTQSAFLKLSAGVTALNQAFQLGAAAVRAIGRAYDATVGKVIDLSKRHAELADDIAKSARAMNVSAEALQGWRSVAGFAGVEAKTFDKSLLNISKTALDAKRGLSTAVDLFDMAGVSALDASGNVRSADDILKEFSQNLKDGFIPEAEQAALSAQLLRDRSGKMINALREGPDVVEDNIERMREWNTLISDEALGAAERYIDSQQLLDEAIQGWTNTIAESAVPALDKLNRDIAETIGGATGARDAFTNWLEKSDVLGTGLNILARIVAAFAAAVVGAGASVQLFIVDFERMIVFTTRALGVWINAIGRLPGGKGLLGALGITPETVQDLFVFAEGMDRSADEMRTSADAAQALALALLDVTINGLRAGDALATVAGGGGGGGGGGAGDAGGAAADAGGAGGVGIGGGVGVGSFVSQLIGTGLFNANDALVQTGDTNREVTEQMVFQWESVSAAVQGTISQMASLGQSSQSTASVVAQIIGALMQTVGGIIGGPYGSAVSGAGGILSTVASAAGDRGLMPTVIADRGASLANIPGGGSHSVVIKRNDEMVLDPSGTSAITRMLRVLEDRTFGNPRDATGSMGMGGGRISVTVPVILDGREIALVVDDQFADMRDAGEGHFAGAA